MSTSDPSTMNLTSLLAELLRLHLVERELMNEGRHAEHQDCVVKKIQMALDIERQFATSKLNDADLLVLDQIKHEAKTNALIAEKMLAITTNKMNFINRLCAPSYGSDGKMNRPTQSGGLLDLKA